MYLYLQFFSIISRHGNFSTLLRDSDVTLARNEYSLAIGPVLFSISRCIGAMQKELTNSPHLEWERYRSRLFWHRCEVGSLLCRQSDLEINRKGRWQTGWLAFRPKILAETRAAMAFLFLFQLISDLISVPWGSHPLPAADAYQSVQTSVDGVVSTCPESSPCPYDHKTTSLTRAVVHLSPWTTHKVKSHNFTSSDILIC